MADDRDVMGPPAEPVECVCIHCNRIFMSDLMIRIDVDGEAHWMCPVPGCGACGYQFDIWPVDNGPSEDDWAEDDEESEEPYDFELEDEDADADSALDIGEEIAEEIAQSAGHFDPPTEWSPESDREDDFADNPFDAFDESDDAIADAEVEENDDDALFDSGVSGQVTHPSRYFTRDDYETAKAAGAYDEAIEREREHWRRIRQEERDRKARVERSETLPGDVFGEDDIPF